MDSTVPDCWDIWSQMVVMMMLIAASFPNVSSDLNRHVELKQMEVVVPSFEFMSWLSDTSAPR